MKIIVRIIGMALGHKWHLAGAYVCMFGATAAYVLLPRFFGNVVDQVYAIFKDGGVGEVSEGKILSIVLVILGLYSIRGLLSYWQTYFGESLSQIVAYDIRNAFYNHVQQLSFAFQDRYHTGNLMSRAISDVEGVRMFVNMGLVRTPYFLSLFIIVPILLIALDWRLGLVSVSFMPAVAYQSAIARFKMRKIWLAVQVKMAELSTVLQENLTGVRVVKAFASEVHEAERFGSKNRDIADDMIEAERLRASNSSFVLFTFQVSLGIILWFGGWRVINGHLTWGELAQFILYMQILVMPVRMMGFMVSNFARAASAGERLFEILDTPSPVKELPTARHQQRVRGHVRFENVSFGYDSRLPVLREINFEATPGKMIALVGAPGSGKSTIVSLIPRFYDVTSGRLTIDGIDVRDFTLNSLRHNIGVVQQDVFLFTTTIRENIAYGRQDASMDEIVEAAKIAQLHSFIESLEEGYDTILGERGSTLSGGQRQRLAIARTVLLDPPVLNLDDAMSSVDAETEDLIRRALESVMLGRTTFVVAHRLSTVHQADIILVLDDGTIVEHGTHQELLMLKKLYREIYDLQLRPQGEILREVKASALLDVNREGLS